jgi:hypothetical protein
MIANLVKVMVAGLTGVVTVAAPVAVRPAAAAYSFEWDNAVSSGEPTDDDQTCQDNYYAMVCFEPAGDKIYVEDLVGDGYSAVARWYTDYGRWGTCRNALGKGHWAVCNKDFAENHVFYFRASLYDGDTHHYVGQESELRSSSTS